MKKVMLYLFMFILLFIPGFKTNAADASIGDAVSDVIVGNKDDIGRKTSGYISWTYNVGSEGESYLDLVVERKNVDIENGYGFIVRKPSTNGGEQGTTYKLYGSGTASYSHTRIKTHDGFSSVTDLGDFETTLNNFFNNKTSQIGFTLGSSSAYLDQKIVSSFPIFDYDDSESIQAYVDNGDTSGAINPEDCNPETYDESMDIVHNLKFSGACYWHKPLNGGYYFKDKDMLSLSWSTPSSEFTYDVEVSASFNVVDSGLQSTPWFSLVECESYSGDAVIFDLVSENRNINLFNDTIAFYVNNAGWDVDDMSQIRARVRNRDGDKVSPWVEISMGESGSASAVVTDNDGNVVENEEYDGSDGYDTNGSNGGSVADDETFTFDSDNISINGIMSYIRSGFGLLGSGGLLALMSSVFVYIPSSVWTLIKTAISMSITVMLISLVKRFVFG